VGVVETKLSQMILDRQLEGILDQGSGCLELFDAPKPDPVYAASLSLIAESGRVVDALYTKAQKLV
jgi:26S proteasome regulatory subunit N6